MKTARHLLPALATAVAIFFAQSLIAAEGSSDRTAETKRARLHGGFLDAAPAPPAATNAYVVPVPQPAPPPAQSALVASAAATAGAAPATAVITNIATCAVRDPEDGGCYASADAADQAWLARGPAAPGAAGDIVDDDPDDDSDGSDDAEDGGTLAPVDAPRIDTVSAPLEKPSFWRDLGRSLSRLVVRKADSRPASIPEEELAALFTADFPLPIRDFPEEKLHDSFDAPRGSHRRHHAIDLPAPRGTPVVAVVDGIIERIGRDRRGGKVCYLRDLSGRFTFYYAHLSQHQKGLRAGDRVRKGARLGYVGATGHASGPHLHFAIFRQDGAPQPTRGLVLNPYLIFASILGR